MEDPEPQEPISDYNTLWDIGLQTGNISQKDAESAESKPPSQTLLIPTSATSASSCALLPCFLPSSPGTAGFFAPVKGCLSDLLG